MRKSQLFELNYVIRFEKGRAMEENRKKKPSILFYAVFVLIGIVIGLLIVSAMGSQRLKEMNTGTFLLKYVGGILVFFLAAWLQLILHEAGHLLFGLLTGYRLSYFRIGGFTIVKEDNGYSFKKLNMAGTAGQCMMVPPDMENGTYPAALYNFGGVIVNIVLALLFLLLSFFARGKTIPLFFCLGMAVMGLVFALTNGIPMMLQELPNDGYNGMNLKKSPEAMRSFWIQMKANDLQVRGVRLKDMPAEWFAPPSDEALKNGMVASLGVFVENRKMDERDMSGTEEWIEKLLGGDAAIPGLYRTFLRFDRILCHIREHLEKGEDPALAEDPVLQEDMSFWNSKEILQNRKTMSNFPALVRTEYLTARYLEKDEARAQAAREAMKKCAETYPLKGEVESEAEWLEML